MKTSCFVILLIFSIFVCEPRSTAQTNALYYEPNELQIAGYAERDIENAKEGEFSNNYLILEKLYPIGWSRDGKFAYLFESPDEECGCYFATLIVQDVRTDKILWRYNYEGAAEKDESIKTFWKSKQAMFSRKLRRFGIVQKRNFDLSQSDIKFGDDVLTAKLETKQTEDSDEFGKISDLFLRLNSQQKGKKILLETHYKLGSYEKPIEAELKGFLKSPFEPRGVFVVIKTLRGWEGFPHITDSSIVGASLTNGFSK